MPSCCFPEPAPPSPAGVRSGTSADAAAAASAISVCCAWCRCFFFCVLRGVVAGGFQLAAGRKGCVCESMLQANCRSGSEFCLAQKWTLDCLLLEVWLLLLTVDYRRLRPANRLGTQKKFQTRSCQGLRFIDVARRAMSTATPVPCTPSPATPYNAQPQLLRL